MKIHFTGEKNNPQNPNPKTRNQDAKYPKLGQAIQVRSKKTNVSKMKRIRIRREKRAHYHDKGRREGVLGAHRAMGEHAKQEQAEQCEWNSALPTSCCRTSLNPNPALQGWSLSRGQKVLRDLSPCLSQFLFAE